MALSVVRPAGKNEQHPGKPRISTGRPKLNAGTTARIKLGRRSPVALITKIAATGSNLSASNEAIYTLVGVTAYG
jgi:hypothetical protein